MDKKQAKLITARRYARKLIDEYHWPENLKRLDQIELNEKIKDKVFLKEIQDSLVSFVNYVVSPEIETVNACAFLTIYKIRYFEREFFQGFTHKDTISTLKALATELSADFDSMICVFREDRTCDLHSPHIPFSEQISILSKRVISKHYEENIRWFKDTMVEYIDIIEKLAVRQLIKKRKEQAGSSK